MWFFPIHSFKGNSSLIEKKQHCFSLSVAPLMPIEGSQHTQSLWLALITPKAEQGCSKAYVNMMLNYLFSHFFPFMFDSSFMRYSVNWICSLWMNQPLANVFFSFLIYKLNSPILYRALQKYPNLLFFPISSNYTHPQTSVYFINIQCNRQTKSCA